MSSQTTTVARGNFAGRLLSKAMSDRKVTAKAESITTADAAGYAVPEEKKETAELVKS